MALCKFLRGKEQDLSKQPLHDGYIWVTHDDGVLNMYIDYYNTDGELVRSKLSAEYAEKIKNLNSLINLENGEGVGSLVGVVPESLIEDETDFANTATADNAVTFGKSNINSGKRSIVTGKLVTNSGANSIVTGLKNDNAGNFNIVGGGNNTIAKNAMGGLVVGEYHTVNNMFNIVGGTHNTINSPHSLVVGGWNTVNAERSITCGLGNHNNGAYSIVGGQFNLGKTDTLLEIGNGTGEANRNNAFEVYTDGAISLDNGETKFTAETIKNITTLIDSKPDIANALCYKGSILSKDELPKNPSVGDLFAVYNVVITPSHRIVRGRFGDFFSPVEAEEDVFLCEVQPPLYNMCSEYFIEGYYPIDEVTFMYNIDGTFCTILTYPDLSEPVNLDTIVSCIDGFNGGLDETITFVISKEQNDSINYSVDFYFWDGNSWNVIPDITALQHEVENIVNNKLLIENGEGVGSLVGVVPESLIEDETDFANTATADNAVTFGKSNINSGKRSIVTGKLVTNSGANSIVTGLNINNAGNFNIVGGGNNTISKAAQGCLVVGEYNKPNSLYSIVGGTNNTINSPHCLVVGGWNTVNAERSLTCGVGNNNNGAYSIVGGKYNAGKADTLFELGNGSSTNDRKNVFEVYTDGSISLDNGETKLTAEDIIETKTYIENKPAIENGEGDYSLVGSVPDKSLANTSTAKYAVTFGILNTNNGEKSLITGQSNTNSGNNSIVTGLRVNNEGNFNIVGGANQEVSNKATGCLIVGEYNKPTSHYNIVGGNNNKVNAPHCLVVGGWNTVNAEKSVTFGSGTLNNSPHSIVGGQYNAGKADTLLELGNGADSNNRSNAFEVYTDGSISLDNGETKLTPTAVNSAVESSVKYIKEKTFKVSDNILTDDIVTLGVGWSGNLVDGFTHSSGSTEPLTFNIGSNDGEKYIISAKFSSGHSEDAIHLAIGNSYPTDPYGKNPFAWGVQSVDGGSLTIKPQKSGWVGSIINLECRKITDDGAYEVTTLFEGLQHGEMPNHLAGFWDTKIGHKALSESINTTRCIGIGAYSLMSLKTGGRNIGLGTYAAPYMECGENNIAIGSDSAFRVTKATDCIAIGKAAMHYGKDLKHNVAIGASSLYGSANQSETESYRNTAIGGQSGYYNGSHSNVFVGYNSGYYNNDYGNVFVGVNAGNDTGYKSTGSRLVVIGMQAGVGDGKSNSTAIGYYAKATKSNQVVLGNNSVTETLLKGDLVVRGTDGVLRKIKFNEDNTCSWEAVTE